MVRFSSWLALSSLLVATAAHADPPAKPEKRPQTKRAPTAMHTTPIAVVNRASATDPIKSEPEKSRETKKHKDAKPKPPCLRDPVLMTRGIEEEKFSLTRCDGSPAPDGVARLSILARPGSVLRPSVPLATLEQSTGTDLTRGIRKLDSKLLVRLQQVADHFQKSGAAPQKIHVISGSRPTSVGSFHASGRALDFWMDGVANTELVAFCKTLPDTGCGYYPNSSFIHLDVRDGSGHVSWIDASGPGEPARYVSSWPPPKTPDLPTDATAKLDELFPNIPIDDHPAQLDVTTDAVPPTPAPPMASQTEADTTEKNL